MENTMLIVDDMEINRKVLSVLFHDSYSIIESESGEEALEILEKCQGSVDIVLLDLMLPGISGFEILEKRKGLDFFKDVPVVVITSSDNLEDQIKVFELGGNDFINKPFVPEIVISRINNVMASHKRMVSVELEAQKMKLKSEMDEMTGIYNKATTELVMNEMLKNSRGTLDVLMVIDIDNFKTVNDTAGHQAGDHVIKIIADLISSMFRKTDVVGRIGGDEFAVLMVDIPSMDIAHSKANELIQIMRYKPNLTLPQYVTLSIGVATNGGKECNYSELFSKTDKALYLAKQRGKAQFCEYGVEQPDAEKDDRPVAVLFSNCRSVCSIVNALMPSQLKVAEVLHFEGLEHLSEEYKKRAFVIFADVSDIEDDASQYWEKMKTISWLKPQQVIAICREGNTAQYIAALKFGIGDMLTSPLDSNAFKRRVLNQIDKLNLKKEN